MMPCVLQSVSCKDKVNFMQLHFLNFCFSVTSRRLGSMAKRERHQIFREAKNSLQWSICLQYEIWRWRWRWWWTRNEGCGQEMKKSFIIFYIVCLSANCVSNWCLEKMNSHDLECYSHSETSWWFDMIQSFLKCISFPALSSYYTSEKDKHRRTLAGSYPHSLYELHYFHSTFNPSMVLAHLSFENI